MQRLFTLAALTLALPAVAQVSSGTLTGAYNADDAIWTIGSPQSEDLPQSGWRSSGEGIEVTMVGLPGPADVGEGDAMHDRVLVVTFTLEGQPRELNMTEPTVMMANGTDGEQMLAHPTNIDLSVTAAELTGSDLAVAGDLVARLTPGGTGNLTIESEEAVIIDGNFQATLGRLDGGGQGD